MRITVVGAGNVGGTLGARLSAVGHEIVFAVRDANDPKHQALGKTAKASVRPLVTAAEGASIVLLATPWDSTQEALRQMRLDEGTIVVDATNPIAKDFSGLALGQTTSGAEQVAAWVPKARVVKCFNSVGYEVMKQPQYRGGNAVMFVAGDDDAACDIVAQLSQSLGFETIIAGKLVMARQLEQLAWLWIHLSVKRQMGRDWAFVHVQRS